MTVGIVVNRTKKLAGLYHEKLTEAFAERGVEVISSLNNEESSELYDKADIIISLGGDGTFLKTASGALVKGTPIFGFNLGTIGFLTEFDPGSIETTVGRICGGEYAIEERSVLEIWLSSSAGREFFSYAINDAVITREIDANVCSLSVGINGSFVATYAGDGIIVATQTGSTAYSLSAGGPIIEPGNDVLLITPICSHKMGSRTIVARPDSIITVRPRDKAKKLRIMADGNRFRKLCEDETVVCSASDRKVRILRIDPPNFYQTVAQKIFGDTKEETDA